MKSKTKKGFISPASLKVIFYLWAILFLLTLADYVYDYNGFELAELRSFGFTLAGFYTFALMSYIETQRTKQRNDRPFSRILILLVSYIFSGILMALFILSALDYMRGNLALDHIYDPVFQLFFFYLLLKTITEMKNGLVHKEAPMLS
ncbi:MAG: hypothetical protein ACTH7W_00800 [Psychrobacter sp.]|uniref:hypothetical protein n=1 Tax=unclassified Psychrobacter TaxID=196806 RepID=UPI0017887DDD|nr:MULTISPECIES: hypothetical protein [unclassified Psychrobacter]MBE0440724.1 hypothetical protein [Psychrobacter sp. FME13]